MYRFLAHYISLLLLYNAPSTHHSSPLMHRHNIDFPLAHYTPSKVALIQYFCKYQALVICLMILFLFEKVNIHIESREAVLVVGESFLSKSFYGITNNLRLKAF